MIEITTGINRAGQGMVVMTPAAYNAFIIACQEIKAIIQDNRPLTIKDIALLAPLVLLADHKCYETMMHELKKPPPFMSGTKSKPV